MLLKRAKIGKRFNQFHDKKHIVSKNDSCLESRKCHLVCLLPFKMSFTQSQLKDPSLYVHSIRNK